MSLYSVKNFSLFLVSLAVSFPVWATEIHNEVLSGEYKHINPKKFYEIKAPNENSENITDLTRALIDGLNGESYICRYRLGLIDGRISNIIENERIDVLKKSISLSKNTDNFWERLEALEVMTDIPANERDSFIEQVETLLKLKNSKDDNDFCHLINTLSKLSSPENRERCIRIVKITHNKKN